MHRRRRDQQDRRGRRADERREVGAALEARDLVEARRERHREQEREQDLHAGLDDAHLLQELDEVAVEALRVGLVAQAARRGGERRGRRGSPAGGGVARRPSSAALDPRARDDVVAAVGPADPGLVAAVVVVAEQHERRRLAERGARLVALGVDAAPDPDERVALHSSATVVGSVWPGRMTVSGGSAAACP